MASISKDPRGCKRILFTGPDGRRRTVRLGKCSLRTAETVRVHIEHMLVARIAGHAVTDETGRWIRDLDDRLRDKLAATGLVPRRESVTLGAFLDGYLKSRSDLKVGTRVAYGHTQRNLVTYFGPDKLLKDITPGDADGWRLSLVTQGLSEATVRRRCGIAKQYLKVAVRRALVVENPFADLVAAGQSNPDRMYFVTREEAEKVLDVCPDAEWRLMFALARFGGLRCPSEILRLRWEDVDWDRGRITVHSPKTERYPGGASRQIPLFPELLPHLREVFEQAEPGGEYVITRYRGKSLNQRTQLTRIVRKAGLEPWPKPWQNLRSSRQTELTQFFPEHVVCAWIGNSQAVARDHYLQVTDEHFAEAAQKAAQYTVAHSRKAPYPPNSGQTESPVYAPLQPLTPQYEDKKVSDVGAEGFEPKNVSIGQSKHLRQSENASGAKCGALGAPDTPIDPQLRIVIHAWPRLSEADRAKILETVRSMEVNDDERGQKKAQPQVLDTECQGQGRAQ